jgi:hypothetical protein
VRTCCRLLAVILVLAALSTIEASLAVAVSPTPSTCSSTMVTLSVTSDQSSYPLGTPVRVTVALHNHSAVSCSYDTGPVSPHYALTNSAGVTVWGSCWFGGSRAPCADYLRHRVLAAGATYRDRLTWDQRSGHPDVTVPAGRYTFRANLLGVTLRTTTSFVLTRLRTVTVTLADSGRHYNLAVGDILSLQLPASPLIWTSAVSSDSQVMSLLPEMNPVAGRFVFEALATGSARVSAVGNPACYPQCLMPSTLFFVTVTVR